MKRTILTFGTLLFLISCGDSNVKKSQETTSNTIENQSVTTNEVSAEDAMASWKDNKGIGPVKSVTLGETIDKAMAQRGEEHFKSLCSACHKPAKKFIGPAPKDILERRTPEWVMNMIMNPEEMIAKDPIAMQLLKEANGAPMANQNVSETQAREILEYFRTIE